jgi:hypothetical protein
VHAPRDGEGGKAGRGRIARRNLALPTVRTYPGHVTKTHILATVREGVSNEVADRMADMKKQGTAEAAEQLLVGTTWLPALLRTPMWTRFEGEALIPWDQSVLRRNQISVKLLSPPLPVTSEFIDAGISIIPDIEIGSHAHPLVFGRACRIRRAAQFCAVVCQVRPSSALMCER